MDDEAVLFTKEKRNIGKGRTKDAVEIRYRKMKQYKFWKEKTVYGIQGKSKREIIQELKYIVENTYRKK